MYFTSTDQDRAPDPRAVLHDRPERRAEGQLQADGGRGPIHPPAPGQEGGDAHGLLPTHRGHAQGQADHGAVGAKVLQGAHGGAREDAAAGAGEKQKETHMRFPYER